MVMMILKKYKNGELQKLINEEKFGILCKPKVVRILTKNNYAWGLFKKLTTKVDLICLPECVAVFSDEKKDINLFWKI